jgi:type VI secretion system protein ImpG
MSDATRYYEEELAYLHEAGREYARLHEARARALAIEDPRSRDPHVERLIESFAFLVGRVRERLDNELPELTHAFLDLVWPHYLRPIPSIALLELSPRPGEMREKQVVPRGFLAEATTGPKSDPIACRFQTAYDVELLPLRLAEAGMLSDEAGRRFLRFEFELDQGADPTRFALDRLRVHLAGEPATAFALYRILQTRVSSVVVSFSRENVRRFGADRIQPVGFAPGEEVLPYPAVSFPGYRLLAEYFAFPEKFLFLDFVGLGPVELPKGERRFRIDVLFSARPPDTLVPSKDDFRLFATPAINIFPKDGEPIAVDHTRATKRVIGDFTHPKAFEVVSVDAVEGIRRLGAERRSYEPFFAFRHDPGREAYYNVTHRFDPDGGWVTDLAFVSLSKETLPPDETLSLRLTCTNGRICREIGIGQIRFAAAGERSLPFADFRNFTRPTEPIYPRIGAGSEWRFISHMALNLLSVSDSAAFRAVLGLYDAAGNAANALRIEAIRKVWTEPAERIERGAPVRGTSFHIEIDEKPFAEEGDLLLFGRVLAEFLSLYSAMNTFTKLTLHRIQTGEVIECPPIRGKQKLI